MARGERARGRHASVLLAREEDDRGEAAVGWAVLGRLVVPGKSRWVLSLFLSLFYFLQLVLI